MYKYVILLLNLSKNVLQILKMFLTCHWNCFWVAIMYMFLLIWILLHQKMTKLLQISL